MTNLYTEGTESFIYYMARKVLVDDLIRLMQDKPETKMHPQYLRTHSLGIVIRFDQKRVDVVDTSFPVILLSDGTGHLLVVDGLNRVIKAWQAGSAKIGVKILELDEFRSIFQPL